MRRRRGRAAAAAGAIVLVVAAWIRMGPLPPHLLDSQAEPSTVLLDRNGEILYEARAADGTRSMRLDARTLPQAIADATIAAEDHRFWRHPGVDPIALARAAARNIRRGRVVEGGSTITQQTAKLLLARIDGQRPRGLGAKLREAITALRLEHRFTKREILALYLNSAAYGNQLIGAERASRAYFGRGADMATPAQAAFLAALPQRPSAFNPYRDPTRARRRQEHVIVRMGALGLLPPDRVGEALEERLALVREPAAFLAPHFVQRVLSAAHAGEGTARAASARITTTLDANLQRTIEGIIRAERPSLERIGAANVAVAVLDNVTGEWLAWEGSGDYDDARNGGEIDGVTSPRQPGSALKPFTYAAAFEQGASPATALPDVASFFPTAQDGILYVPRNYDGRFRGPLLARRALAGSENVPAVALASRVGVPALLRLLRAAGLATFDKNAAYYGLGLTLGDAEVRLDQLIAAYAMFARGGLAIEPRMTRAATAQVTPAPPAPARLVSPRTAFWISDILSDNDARAFVFGRGGNLEFPFPVAVKTGTSQAYHDNWTVGYTRAVTVGVWVGNFDRRPLVGSSGVAGAGPIFHAVMLAATAALNGAGVADADRPTVAEPERTSKRTVCVLSGMRASPWCPAQADEWLPDDRAGTDDECSWHRPASRGVVIEWPAEYVEWARGEHLLDRVIPMPASARAARLRDAPAAPETPSTFRLVSPPDGAVYLIDPTLRREFQTLALRAAAASAAIEWRVDGQRVGATAAGAAIDWPLAPGAHVVTARDERGREASAAFLVK